MALIKLNFYKLNEFGRYRTCTNRKIMKAKIRTKIYILFAEKSLTFAST